MKRSWSVENYLRGVARGERIRVIDLRGDYQHAIPGAIPTRFYPDMFYEEVGWVQDMLGVRFESGVPVVLICATGASSQEAVDLFWRKNRNAPFNLVTLEGGMLAYEARIRSWTAGYRRQEQFMSELTDITTPANRYQFLITSLWERRKPKGWQRLWHPASWF
ncbi:MAG: rhodanese-like domain-containing protein [Magnetococcales bacterium]|nr:rhodanese-like domain-containing protein [Magnetococcales bacterium]